MVLLISSCVLTLVVFYDDYLVRSDIIIVLLNLLFFLFCYFFFFQAEDGIRDVAVTGVQTCALPIWPSVRSSSRPGRTTTRALCYPPRGRSRAARRIQRILLVARPLASSATPASRSEERRVGKECRSRWSTYH